MVAAETHDIELILSQTEALRRICRELIVRVGTVRRMRGALQRRLVVHLVTHLWPHTVDELVVAARRERMTTSANVDHAVRTAIGMGAEHCFRILEDGRVVVHPSILPMPIDPVAPERCHE